MHLLQHKTSSERTLRFLSMAHCILVLNLVLIILFVQGGCKRCRDVDLIAEQNTMRTLIRKGKEHRAKTPWLASVYFEAASELAMEHNSRTIGEETLFLAAKCAEEAQVLGRAYSLFKKFVSEFPESKYIPISFIHPKVFEKLDSLENYEASDPAKPKTLSPVGSSNSSEP